MRLGSFSSNNYFSGTDQKNYSQIGRFSPCWRHSEIKVFLFSTWARSPWNLFYDFRKRFYLTIVLTIVFSFSFQYCGQKHKLCLPPEVHCFAVTLFSGTRMTHHCWDAWANQITDFPLHIGSRCQTMCYMLHDFPQGCLCLTDAACTISDLHEGLSTSPHIALWTFL